MMRTATVIARSKPYILPLELARGILHRMSNRYWEWKLAGIDMTERFGDALAASRIAFSRAVACQDDPTCRGEVSEQVFQLARALMANMSLWMAEVVTDRHRNATTRDATYMIGRLPKDRLSNSSAVAFAKSFEMAAIPTSWKAIQPEPDKTPCCQKRHLRHHRPQAQRQHHECQNKDGHYAHFYSSRKGGA